jgi:hypothetical protein
MLSRIQARMANRSLARHPTKAQVGESSRRKSSSGARISVTEAGTRVEISGEIEGVGQSWDS